MDNATAAAIVAVAHLAKPVVDKGIALIESLLGEPCKVAGGMLADQIYGWQWLNRVGWAARVRDVMDKEKIAERIVPPSFLLPILDAVGNVDDEDLQQMFARLTAAGVADDAKQQPAFSETLRRMSGADARYLQTVRNEAKSPDADFSIEPTRRPGELHPSAARFLALGLLGPGYVPDTGKFQLVSEGREYTKRLRITPFGWQFIDVVLPAAESKDAPPPPAAPPPNTQTPP